MSGDANPAGARRLLVPVVVLALVAAAGVGVVALSRPKAPRPPPADPFEFRLPVPTPRGEPVAVASTLKAGDEFRGSGTFAYRQEASGSFGQAPRFPTRIFEGSFRSTRRVTAGAEGRTLVSVDVVVSASERRDGGEARAHERTVTFVFPDGVEGPMSAKEARLDVPEDLREAIEPVVVAFSGKVPLPSRPVRVGDSYSSKEAADLEPMRRQAFRLFMMRNRGTAPVEGGGWVEGRVSRAGGEALDVRTLLRQAQEGPVSAEGSPEVATAYETVVRGRTFVGIADGAPRDLEWSAARRMRVVGTGFDYRIEVALRASLVEERTAPR
jgi:hypothetical protein